MAWRLTLILLLSALVLLSALQPTHLIARQSRCSRHQVVVLKVPSKKKSGTAKGAKKPAGFAKRSAPPKPATALPKGSWDALRGWLKDRGAKVGGVVAEEVLPGLRGAVATRSFADGDVILSVPQQCILEEKRAEASPVAAVWAGSDVPAYAKVALHVLWLGQTNKWTAVLSMLPTMTDWDAEGGPLQLWSDAEIAAAEDGVLSQRVGRLKKTAEQLYELVEQKWEGALGLPPPSLDEFLWAVVTVRSRTFASKAQGGLQAMVVPGVDLCNHDHPENVNTRHDFVGGEFKLVATRDIAVGEEVCARPPATATHSTTHRSHCPAYRCGSPTARSPTVSCSCSLASCCPIRCRCGARCSATTPRRWLTSLPRFLPTWTPPRSTLSATTVSSSARARAAPSRRRSPSAPTSSERASL